LQLRLGRAPLTNIDSGVYGMALMEAQRRVPGNEKLGRAGLSGADGHVLQSKVLAAGVTHRISYT
jgi:hypothetical protein